MQPRTFKLTIAYDGTDFAGWQVQPNQPTIQQTLQRALEIITGEAVPVIGSGRTDSGVHAIGQVASCTIAHWRSSPSDLMRALNSQLPPTIVVLDAIEACDDFHAIRDAISKRYRYQLQLGGLRDAFTFRYRWHVHQNLDLELIRAAARRFEGRLDFAGFQASGAAPKTTTVRDVRHCQLIDQGKSAGGGVQIAIEIEADGFLYNMVRNIVGTLVEIGRGRQPPEWVDELIAAGDRTLAGPTAPAHGLFLVRVDYPEGLLEPRSGSRW